MSNRAQRRAAEREILKAARRAAVSQSAEDRFVANELAPETAAVSEAQLAANRANAQKSTGPKTPEGKAHVHLNALKTGLTGRTVCLPTDDAVLYQELIAKYSRFYRPVGPEEQGLVQSIVDIRWRLDRIPGLLMALLNKGRIELSQDDPDFVKRNQGDLLEIEVMAIYEKEFKNLNLQESRLARRREREIAELKRLQQERKANEAVALERAAAAHLVAEKAGQPFSCPEIGFDFSRTVFETYLSSLSPAQKEKILQNAAQEVAAMPAAA